MSRSSLTLVLLLAAGAMLTACTDRRSAAPTAVADRIASFDREREEGTQATIVRGTGHANMDVPNVQSAVDQGGLVLLKGHFSFSFDETPGTKNRIAPDLLPLGLPATAEVKITRAVSILGEEDEDDGMTTIDGGTIPFYIEAPGQTVSIRRVRFVNPISHAMLVFAVRGLEIASTKVEGLKTFSRTVNGAIGIYTIGAIPNPTKQGKPSNVAGKIVIADNDFDVHGGTAAENVLGITVFSVGDSTTPVEARVSGNRIRNTTEPAINFRRVVGQVSIDHNVINTGTIGVPNARSQVIRVANLGTYRIAHNVIECDWTSVADAEGIGVFSQFSTWPIEHATVEHNRVTMSPSAGTTFDPFSAGIGVYGFANANVVRHNIIRGTARAGISMPVFPLSPPVAHPQDNAFLWNAFAQFTPTVADIFIGQNAGTTRIVGPGTVLDQRAVTAMVP